jgi:hypothetical protein
MIINRRLNLVIPVIRADETVLYIHATPIMAETVEKYHMVLARTFSEFAINRLDVRSGPSVAAMILKRVAQETLRFNGINWWDGDDGVGGPAGLLAEIKRLCNVVVVSGKGEGSTVPLQQALDDGTISDDERAEVANVLVFFTVVSWMAPRIDRERMVQGLAAVYELQTTYSNVTEYGSSLKTSTVVVRTGGNAQV